MSIKSTWLFVSSRNISNEICYVTTKVNNDDNTSLISSYWGESGSKPKQLSRVKINIKSNHSWDEEKINKVIISCCRACSNWHFAAFLYAKSPHWKWKEICDECHFAMTSGTVLRTTWLLIFCFVYSNGPVTDCEISRVQDFFIVSEVENDKVHTTPSPLAIAIHTKLNERLNWEVKARQSPSSPN